MMLLKIREEMKRKDNQKGFTLVELIIVMGILALLAGIAVPRFGATLGKAKENAVEANVQMIKKAAELAYINGVASDDIKMKKLVEDGYLDKNPQVAATCTVDGEDFTEDHYFQVSVSVITGTASDLNINNIKVIVTDSPTDPTVTDPTV